MSQTPKPSNSTPVGTQLVLDQLLVSSLAEPNAELDVSEAKKSDESSEHDVDNISQPTFLQDNDSFGEGESVSDSENDNSVDVSKKEESDLSIAPIHVKIVDSGLITISFEDYHSTFLQNPQTVKVGLVIGNELIEDRKSTYVKDPLGLSRLFESLCVKGTLVRQWLDTVVPDDFLIKFVSTHIGKQKSPTVTTIAIGRPQRIVQLFKNIENTSSLRKAFPTLYPIKSSNGENVGIRPYAILPPPVTPNVAKPPPQTQVRPKDPRTDKTKTKQIEIIKLFTKAHPTVAESNHMKLQLRMMSMVDIQALLRLRKQALTNAGMLDVASRDFLYS